MKFKRHLKPVYGLEQIEIVPLINILFLLLMFVLLTSSLVSPSGINVKLPKAITSDIFKEENFIITITSENVIYLNNKIVTHKELQQALNKSNNKHRQILIKTDRRASVGRIIDVWDLCRSAGIEKINIATNQGKQ